MLLFFNRHLANLSSTLTEWKLASWEKVNFLWWEGEGWGTVYIEKKTSTKAMLKYHIITYFLLALNYFCIYTWDYSLCLDLKCTSGGIFKNPSKYHFFPHKYNCSCAFCGFQFHLFDFISNYYSCNKH